MKPSRMHFAMKSATAVVLICFSQHVHAAPFSIGSANVSTPLPLTGYAGTAASLPSQFTTDATGGYQGVFTSGTSAYTVTNGLYAGLASSGGTDPGFAARVAVATSLHMTFSITNTSGTIWSGGTLTLTEVQYQDAVATPNTITITTDDGTGTPIVANTAGTSDPFLTGNTAFNELSATGLGTTNFQSAAKTINYNNAIAQGATLIIEATWTPGGGGNRPILGVADLAFTGNTAPTPEPGSAVLLGAAAGFTLIRRRNRRA